MHALGRFLRRHRGTLGLIAAALGFFLAMDVLGVWMWVGVPHVTPTLADWYGTLSASDCHAQGIDVYVTNPCDLYGRIHVYGHPWLYLSWFGLTRETHFISGMAIIVIPFIVAAAFTLDPKTPREFLLALVILLSPASMLGIERANIDLFVFVLGVVTSALVATRMRANVGTAIGLHILSGLLKYYPFTGGANLWWGVRSRIGVICVSVIYAVGSAIAIASMWWQIERVTPTMTDSPPGGPSFGADLLFLLLNQQTALPIHFDSVTLATIVALTLTSIIGCLLTFRLEFRSSTIWQRSAFSCGAALLIGCYFAISNYDYRLVFVIMTVPLILAERDGMPTFVFRAWIGLILFTLWAYGINRAIKGAIGLFVADDGILQQVGGALYLIEYLAAYPLFALFVGGLVRLAIDHWRSLQWRGEFGEFERARQ